MINRNNHTKKLSDSYVENNLGMGVKKKLLGTIRMTFGDSISREFLAKHGMTVGVQALHDSFIIMLKTKLFAQDTQTDVHEEPKKVTHEYLAPGIWNNIKFFLNKHHLGWFKPKFAIFEYTYIVKKVTHNYMGYSFPTEKK